VYLRRRDRDRHSGRRTGHQPSLTTTSRRARTSCGARSPRVAATGSARAPAGPDAAAGHEAAPRGAVRPRSARPPRARPFGPARANSRRARRPPGHARTAVTLIPSAGASGP
jgi:hypothetical protein